MADVKRFYWKRCYELKHLHWALCDTESARHGRVTDHNLVLLSHYRHCVDGRPLSEQEMPARIVALLNGHGGQLLEEKQQEIERLKALIREMVPFVEAVMPESYEDMAIIYDICHRARGAAE